MRAQVTRRAIAIAVLWIPATALAGQRSMGPSPVGNPGTWITDEDYPPDAIRANRTGRVVAKVGVDSTGRVVSCSVLISSGTTSLDEKTCEIATARGSFNPATDAHGDKIASTYLLPVKWQIPDQPDTATDLSNGPRTSTVEVETVIGENGNLVSCKTVTKSDTATARPVRGGRHRFADAYDLSSQGPAGSDGGSAAFLVDDYRRSGSLRQVAMDLIWRVT